MTQLVLRQARTGDEAQIIDLLKQIMNHHEVPPPRDEEMVRIVETIMQAATHAFFVAEQAGRLLGLCALVFSLSTWRAVRVCELQDVVVASGARGKGVGKQLVRGALDFARQEGCAWAYLTAETWNLDAHDFYRGLGFKEKAVLYFEHDLTPGS